MTQINPPGLADLDALVSLINESVSVYKEEYENARLFVPHLNNPSSFEHDLMQERGSERLRIATNIIEAACAQLTAIVVRPELTLVNVWLLRFSPLDVLKTILHD